MNFRCTGLPRRSKSIHLDAKNEIHFTQSLEQNGMSLLPGSKCKKKRKAISKQEIAKSRVPLKKVSRKSFLV